MVKEMQSTVDSYGRVVVLIYLTQTSTLLTGLFVTKNIYHNTNQLNLKLTSLISVKTESLVPPNFSCQNTTNTTHILCVHMQYTSSSLCAGEPNSNVKLQSFP